MYHSGQLRGGILIEGSVSFNDVASVVSLLPPPPSLSHSEAQLCHPVLGALGSIYK